jgi:hypothetical protein
VAGDRLDSARPPRHAPRARIQRHAIAPFAVQDESGNRWGLIDETVGHGFPRAELHPNRLGFNPPWNGDYDTYFAANRLLRQATINPLSRADCRGAR